VGHNDNYEKTEVSVMLPVISTGDSAVSVVCANIV